MPSIFDTVNKTANQVTSIGSRAAAGYSGIKNVAKTLSEGDFTTAEGAISGAQGALSGIKTVAAALGNNKLIKTAGQIGTVLGQANRVYQTFERVAPMVDGLKNALSGEGGGLLGFLSGGLSGGAKAITGLLNSDPSFAANGFTSQHFLKAMLARKDPLLAFEWVGVINDPSSPSGVIPSIYIDSIDTPSLQMDKTAIYKQGSNVYFAGAQSVNDATMTLYSDASGMAFRVASSWFGLTMQNETGNFRLPKDYKKEVVIYIFDAQRKAVVTLHLHGVFPINWDSYNLNETADPLQTRLTLSVDSIEFKD